MDLNIDTIEIAIMKHLPESEDWMPRDREEASRIVRAALTSLLGDDMHPSEIRKLMTGFENGYGCWLDTVEEAMHKGLADLPPSYTDFIKGEVVGAFSMAKAFLFDIAGHNDLERIEEMAKQERREEGAYSPDDVR